MSVEIIKKTTPTLEEKGLSTKDVLQKARKTKNDEFYTRYEDIEKELKMYPKSVWKNKTVFCNCDVVDDCKNSTSAFVLYFLNNFNVLGLKKLICTHYAGKVDLFHQGPKGYIFTKEGFREGKKVFPPNYTGSFDHPLSLKILREDADIVCTNPPFSRAKDFWRLIMESGKKFLIISNVTNIKNDSYIPYFLERKVWPGYNEVYWYLNPKRELTRAAGRWYTNISVKNRASYKRLRIMPLKEIPAKEKKYDDSKVLMVNNGYIPSDYKKPFAVSVNPILNGLLEKGYKIVQEKQYRPYINGREVFARVLVKKV